MQKEFFSFNFFFSFQINAKRLYQVSLSVDAIANPLSDIPYFYEPIFFPEELVPLSHMVIVFSLYSSDERTFLVQLAQLLGADVQESFVRSNKPLLICPEARSAKYQAAIRWSEYLTILRQKKMEFFII